MLKPGLRLVSCELEGKEDCHTWEPPILREIDPEEAEKLALQLLSCDE
jgi:hypothetical protein